MPLLAALGQRRTFLYLEECSAVRVVEARNCRYWSIEAVNTTMYIVSALAPNVSDSFDMPTFELPMEQSNAEDRLAASTVRKRTS